MPIVKVALIIVLLHALVVIRSEAMMRNRLLVGIVIAMLGLLTLEEGSVINRHTNKYRHPIKSFYLYRLHHCSPVP